MAYEKTIWTNGATALSAENMNHIENGIAALDEGKVDKENGKGLSSNDYTSGEKAKLAGIETGAEVNQNAFSNVKVGSTTIAADSKTDTLELVAGTNVTLTPDAANDKITIAATEYSNATTTTAGLMSASDKVKLNSVSANANCVTNKTITYTTTATTISSGSTETFYVPLELDNYKFVGIRSFKALVASSSVASVILGGWNFYGSNLSLELWNLHTYDIDVSIIELDIAYFT